MKNVDYAQRHGFDVINAVDPTESIKNFLLADDQNQILAKDIDPFSFSIKDAGGFTILPISLINHTIDGKAGVYDGMYVAEEYHGLPHPFLLIPANRVVPRN